MGEAASTEAFEKIVEWAFSTLPQKIRDLPDFPGIQVSDEPPEGYLRSRTPRGELLGLFVGVPRTERSYNRVRLDPELIFVFRGPILRCSKGDLQAEVKRVVWHEVAHWLGHDEEEVRELGLSASSPRIEGTNPEPPKREPRPQVHNRTVDGLENRNQSPRCIECYSQDVTCHKVEKPLSYAGANPFLDSPTVEGAGYRCNACGYEWVDEDKT